MQFYRCDLTLHDYLFFATTERGKVAETGPFIHNYALTYALGWALSPYHNEKQQPHYREELAQVHRRYITPAALLYGSYIVSQYNTMSESYSMSKSRSTGYPDWGFIRCFRPGSTFRCYSISAEVVHFPRYLRLGKFMAKARLNTTPAKILELRSEPMVAQQDRLMHPLLAWDDLEQTARPPIFDIVVNPLPGHMIAHPSFEGVPGPYLLARFENENAPVQIPLRMGYYGEHVCASW